MANKERVCSVCKTNIEYVHKHKPILCPNCNSEYWDKPKDERDLFLLQDEYINSDRDKEYLTPLYDKLFIYAQNIIKHKLRNKVILSQEDFNQKSNDIAIIMVERYLKYPEEKIETSFGGMMLKIANGVLYSKKGIDTTISLSQTFNDSEKEFVDTIYSYSDNKELFDKYDPQHNEDNYSMQDIVKEFEIVINKIYEKIRKEHSSQNFLYLLGLKHFLTGHKEQFTRNFNNLISNKTKNNIEKTKLILRNYLYTNRQA